MQHGAVFHELCQCGTANVARAAVYEMLRSEPHDAGITELAVPVGGAGAGTGTHVGPVWLDGVSASAVAAAESLHQPPGTIEASLIDAISAACASSGTLLPAVAMSSSSDAPFKTFLRVACPPAPAWSLSAAVPGVQAMTACGADYLACLHREGPQFTALILLERAAALAPSWAPLPLPPSVPPQKWCAPHKCIAASRDWAWVTVAGLDGRLIIWDTRDKASIPVPVIASVGDGKPEVHCLAWLPGDILAASDADGTLSFWTFHYGSSSAAAAASQPILLAEYTQMMPNAHGKTRFSRRHSVVAMSDGRLATFGWDPHWSMRLWSACSPSAHSDGSMGKVTWQRAASDLASPLEARWFPSAASCDSESGTCDDDDAGTPSVCDCSLSAPGLVCARRIHDPSVEDEGDVFASAEHIAVSASDATVWVHWQRGPTREHVASTKAGFRHESRAYSRQRQLQPTHAGGASASGALSCHAASESARDRGPLESACACCQAGASSSGSWVCMHAFEIGQDIDVMVALQGGGVVTCSLTVCKL